MRVRLMQIIDYWVGVPLCFLLTAWNSLLGFFRKREFSFTPQKILFIELSEMGSAILAYSMLVQAQRRFPQAQLYFLIFKRNRESCEILDLLPKENILVVDDRNFVRFAISTLRMVFRLHQLKIDTAVDLELFSRCTALITYLSGARNRVGFHRATNEGLYRGKLLTHEVPYNPHMHIAFNFLALLAAISADPREVPLVKKDLRDELIALPKLNITTAESEEIRTLLLQENQALAPDQPLLILNPDPGDALPLRGWPLERFAESAKLILAEYPASVAVVTGLARSKPYALALQKSLGPERCLDLTGKTATLRSVVALFSCAKLLLTNDSGPAHLAALADIDAVVLFGPETPALYGPLSDKAVTLFAHYSCSPCLSALNHRYSKCNDNKCLQAISVEQVVSELRRIMDGVSAQRALKVVKFE